MISSAGCVVINKDKVLLVKSQKGEWGLPKGRVEPGETEEQAAHREVIEETGITPIIGKKKKVIHYTVEGEPKKVTFFEAKGKGKVFIEEELQDAGWFAIDKALVMLAHQEQKDVLVTLTQS